MVKKARSNDVIFRPHFKTHQSLEIASWFSELGVDKITVSTLDMALYFAADGWKDITVAFPVNIPEIDKINRLASRIQLNLLVEDPDTLMKLDSVLDYTVNIFIKIDVGYGRTGIPYYSVDRIDHLIETFQKTDLCNWSGFLAHAGHSYKCSGSEEIFVVHQESKSAILSLLKYKKVFPHIQFSIGDTPTCSIADDFGWCDEIRPGNFVFYDLAQWQIGSNSLEEIAVAMACPVVAKHPERSEIVLYGGGAHFAKDRIKLQNGKVVWGLLVEHSGHSKDSWKDMNDFNWMTSMSQEHGILHTSETIMEKTKVGDILTILPIHSCMAGLAMGQYLSTGGEIIERL
ncbi:MAG: alanine racemase [Bacteroidia bacterium]|nr:alanine racemase [Bacteroidia bacterium]